MSTEPSSEALREAPDLHRYAQSPEGRFVRGEGFLFWCVDRTLFGLCLWGALEEAHARAAFDALELQQTRFAAPHRTLFDARRVEHVSPGALSLVERFTRERRERLAAQVLQQAVLFGPGLAGFIAAGFNEALRAPYPFRAFEDPEEALTWLGCPRAGLAQELDALVEAARAQEPEAARLRRWLLMQQELRRADLEVAARALGVSTRTLQRRLQAQGTSFQGELSAARLERARAALSSGTEKVASLAASLGFSSAQHFGRVFRDATGLRPSEYRARHGAAKPSP